MLTKGIWPRFCIEEFDWLLGSNIHIAFPVVCFCDIPIEASSYHRSKYGNYAIALNKDYATSLDINPMWYLQKDTSIMRHMKEMCKHPIRVTLDTIPGLLKPMLPFIKPTIGGQPERNSERAGAMEFLSFEEEMEWRHCPSGLMHTWKFGYDRQIVTNTDHKCSQDHRIKLDLEAIEQVIVTSDDEREEIERRFPCLKCAVIIGKSDISQY